MASHVTDPGSPTPSFFDRDHSWAITGAALVLRLAMFLVILLQFGDAGFILPPFSDGLGYVTIANNVLHGNGFSLETEVPFIPDTKRVPLYPLFLAGTFAVTAGAYWLAALLQTFLSAAIVFFIYRITASFANRRAAFAAAALAAVYPFAIFLSTQLLAETLFTFVLFAAFAFFVRSAQLHGYRAAIGGGLLMGAATLVKPAGQYIPFLLAPFVALKQSGLMRVSQPVVYLVCFLLVMSPWIVRNSMTSGHAELSHEANILLDLHYAGYMALKETGAAGRADEFRTVKTSEEVNAVSRGELIRRLLVVMAHDPVGFAKYLALVAVPFSFGDGFVTMVTALSPHQAIPAWNFSTSPAAFARTLGFGILPAWLIVLSIGIKGMWGLVLLSAIGGFVMLLRGSKDKVFTALGMAIVIAYFMFAGGPVQSARYRQPVEPLIFLLAGIGIAEMTRLVAIHARTRRTLPR